MIDINGYTKYIVPIAGVTYYHRESGERYMNQDECTKKLLDLGFLPREVRIYLALLKGSDFAASEVAASSEIPRQKIYELLGILVKKGICTEKIGKIKRYNAVAPKIVFDNLLEKHKIKAEQILSQETLLAHELMTHLSAIHEENQSLSGSRNFIEILKGIKQINRRWVEIIEGAEVEILCTMKPHYRIIEEEIIDEAVTAIGKGINIRTVYEFSVGRRTDLTGRKLLDVISRYIPEGEEARIGTRVPFKLTIIDGMITMLQPGASVLVITHKDFASQMKQMFGMIWEAATPFDDFSRILKGREPE